MKRSIVLLIVIFFASVIYAQVPVDPRSLPGFKKKLDTVKVRYGDLRIAYESSVHKGPSMVSTGDMLSLYVYDFTNDT